MKQRRDLTDEADFLLGTADELAELRRRIIDSGNSEAEANGIIGWLVAKRAGDTSGASPRTRARYRRILRELGEPVPTSPDRGRLAVVGGGNGGRRNAQNPRSRQAAGFRQAGEIAGELAS